MGQRAVVTEGRVQVVTRRRTGALAAGMVGLGAVMVTVQALRHLARLNRYPKARYQVVGLGDSVMAGVGSLRAAIPARYAREVSEALGEPVGSTNLARCGQTTSELIEQLRHDPSSGRALTQASVVLIIIGANDLAALWKPWSSSGSTVPDQAELLATLQSNLLTIIQLVAQQCPPATPIALGTYWNVFTDGAMGRLLGGRQQRQASRAVTEAANAHIQLSASQAAVAVADLYSPFHSSGDDPQRLLALDGEHPNSAGNAAITQAFLHAVPPTTLASVIHTAGGTSHAP